MAEKLSLGGRCYVPAGVGPVRHDLFVLHQARHAGLYGAQIREDEPPEEFAARLLDGVLTSGRALLLLGALLLPDGTKVEQWTEELAYRTAGELGGINDPGEKKRLYGELITLIHDFFVNGLGPWIASRRSSGAAEPPSSSTRSIPATASGVPSSAGSPATTTTSPSG